MNYYPRYPAHYVSKTMHLSMEQDGAYTRLLDWCYMNERAIPHASRYVIARAMTPSERKSVDAVLSEFFGRESDAWTNGRAMEEIGLAQPKIAAAKANGKKGGRPRKENPEGSAEKPSGFTDQNPLGSQNKTHEEPRAKAPQSPRVKQEQEPESANADLSPAAPDDPRRPPCPHERIIALYHEVLPELRQVREWNENRRKLLGRRWAESPERQSLGWWREFFGYVRKSRFLMGLTTGRGGRPFDCDLEWLVRPASFAKVIEGKYEDGQA